MNEKILYDMNLDDNLKYFLINYNAYIHFLYVCKYKKL